MQIQGNSIALKSIQAMYAANKAIAVASERISTGLRINSSADDPVGLMVATRLKTNIQSVSKSVDAVNSGLGMTGVVDSALSKMSDVLSNMYALASSPGSITSADYTTAMTAYKSELSSLSSGAVYNGSSLMASTTTISLGTGDFAPNSISLSQTDLSTLELDGTGTDITDLDITDLDNATNAATLISDAIDTVSSYQASIGAQSNVLSHHMDFLSGLNTSHSSSYGNIMHADLAQEAANLAAAQINRDGATAMMAQANSMNKDVVSYLLKSVS